MKDHFRIEDGWLENVEHQPSPHFNQRPQGKNVSLLVVHNISLPPGQFGGDYISDLFLGQLSPDADPFFREIYQLEVSAHCLIRRDGRVIQYVSFDNRAWHAGVSNFCGHKQCNDFSIGVELEGTDDIPYETAQYASLAKLAQALKLRYPELKHVAGHNNIAPERKTDPGKAFDWPYFMKLAGEQLLNNPYLEEKT